MINCPKCDKPMQHEEDEPEVNIHGGWFCSECMVIILDGDVDDGEN